LNKDAFQWGSKSAKEATAGPKTEVRATARWSVAEAGEDKRSLILFWAKAAPPTEATEAATAVVKSVRRTGEKRMLCLLMN
jgi:hypothetical protein